MLNRETKQIMALCAVLFLGGLAVFGFLLYGAVENDFRASLTQIPWWIFFAVAFMCGPGAGLTHIAAVMAPDATTRTKLMAVHLWWWVAALPALVMSFWVFWQYTELSWVWLLAASAFPSAMALGAIKKTINN